MSRATMFGNGTTAGANKAAALIIYGTGTTAGSQTITVGGNRVDRPQTDVGIVFQDAIMLDWRGYVLAGIGTAVLIRTKVNPAFVVAAIVARRA